VEVCPVECIIAGKPENEWPWYFIDPDTCIDCGACIPECPFEAIFVEDEVPDTYEVKGEEQLSMPKGTAGFDEVFDGTDHNGEAVHLEGVRTPEAGETIDLTQDIQPNYDYFQDGPGYSALD